MSELFPDLAPDLSDVCVLFDLDGTLIDTADDLAAAMNHALAMAGREAVPAARVRALVGQGAKAMLIRGFGESGTAPEDMDSHVEVFLDYYLAHIADYSRPFPSVLQAIDDLGRDGAAIAICTNKREGPSRLLMEKLGLTDKFAAIVGMDTVRAAKPDPAPARHCLTLTGRRSGVFIGDSDTDIRTAQAAAMPCLAATFGYGPLTLASQADAMFERYESLPGLVRAALRRASG